MYLVQMIKGGKVQEEIRWFDLGQLEQFIYKIQEGLGQEHRNLVKTMEISFHRLDEYTRYRRKYTNADILILKG